MSWLLNSMDDVIVEIYLLYLIAKAIWDVVTFGIFGFGGLISDVWSP